MIARVTRLARRSAERSGGVLRSVEVLACVLPGFGVEGEHIACGVLSDADQDIAQVVEGIDRVELAGGQERVEDAGALSALVASGEEPIFAAYRESRFILPMSRVALACTTRGILRSRARSTSCIENRAAVRRCTFACCRTARA
jgi:hypothetical protein